MSSDGSQAMPGPRPPSAGPPSAEAWRLGATAGDLARDTCGATCDGATAWVATVAMRSLWLPSGNLLHNIT